MALTALLLFLSWACPALAGVRYDQTQTGDYNVHLDLKNIEIIAYVDSGAFGINDYEYDYNDYTLKPPSNGSAGGQGENATKPAVSAGNSTAAEGSSTAVPQNSTESATTTSTPEASSVKPSRRCGAGFYRDSAGRCRRLRRPVKLTGLLQKATNRISGK